MTYENIYTKFMIEYDKANITSSYPSLTEYEVATILDKAYLALIGQKVSGNNIRRSTIESDVKSISDIQPLIKTKSFDLTDDDIISNRKYCKINGKNVDFLYFISATIARNDINVPVKLITHESVQKFFETDYNKPWIKIPVCYIDNDTLYIIYENKENVSISNLNLTYIKNPIKFVVDNDNYNFSSNTDFECNDSMAEELISLAVTFALENVESSRLNNKLNTRGLEA